MELPQGWFSPENIATYKVLLESLRDHANIAELGCWKGRSLCSVAETIIAKDIEVFAVDTFVGTDGEGNAYDDAKSQDIAEIFENNMKQFAIGDLVVQLKMTTAEALNYIPVEGFDLVFIDADHSYEGVKRDIQGWLRKVKPGGIISGHDFYREGVNRALHELLWPVTNESTVWFKRV